MSGTKGQKWPAYKTRRRRALRFLIEKRNQLAREAVFDDEEEDVKKYDETINLLQALDFSPYQDICPMCKEPMYTVGKVEPCCFYGVGKADPWGVGKIENLQLSHCYACGFTTVDGF